MFQKFEFFSRRFLRQYFVGLSVRLGCIASSTNKSERPGPGQGGGSRGRWHLRAVDTIQMIACLTHLQNVNQSLITNSSTSMSPAYLQPNSAANPALPFGGLRSWLASSIRASIRASYGDCIYADVRECDRDGRHTAPPLLVPRRPWLSRTVRAAQIVMISSITFANSTSIYK